MPHPNYYVKIQKKRETSNSRRHFFTAKSDKKRHSNWIGSPSECRSNFVKNETLRFGKRPKNRNASFWNRERLVLRIINLEDYFFITIKNASLNYLEKEQRRKDMTADAFDGVSISGESPEDILVSEELFAHYVKALDRLPERCREIFIRVREEKQSYAEVAKDLGISVNTVDVQLQKAIGRMRDMLSRYISGTEN